ncbi:MAG: response regulator transcription factor [Phycisphaerae bacterium]|nr:response regulator transcription factor [Phycisphaerae bacterium]
MPQTRIFIVDDHPIVRDGLKLLIDHQDDLTVCGEADDIKSALRGVAQAKPDVVLTDITLKASDGLELTKDLKILYPDLHIIVLSIHDESTYAERALRAGAQGYLMKEVVSDHIIEAIHTVCRDEIFVSDQIAKRLLHKIVGGKSTQTASGTDALSDRELEIFKLIGQGFKASQIAKQLHLSVKTVETYRARIKEKLDIKDAGSLLQFAIQWGHTPQD